MRDFRTLLVSVVVILTACGTSQPETHPALRLTADDALTNSRAPLCGTGAHGMQPQAFAPLGSVSVLVLRLTFPDATSNPISRDDANALFSRKVGPFYRRASYNKTTMQHHVTAALRLPKKRATYGQNGEYMLWEDAKQVAKAAHIDTAAYDRVALVFPNVAAWGWSGRASLNEVYLNGQVDAWLMIHELGHTFGLPHAGRWVASGESVIGPGSNITYGHPYDPMGLGNETGDFQAASKVALGWLEAQHVTTIKNGGRYTVSALSQPDGVRALQIPVSGERSIWLKYRPQRPATSHTHRALFAGWGAGAKSVPLIDFTPASPSTDSDVGLRLGASFSHRIEGINISLVSATATQAVVDVNWERAPKTLGNVSVAASATAVQTNVPVTFQAEVETAADNLVISWWQGARYLGAGQRLTHAWSSAQEAAVDCVVSNVQGQTVRTRTVVTIGTPTIRRITGVVRDLDGRVVANARVALLEGDAPIATAYSDQAGRYTLSNLVTGTYRVAAFGVAQQFGSRDVTLTSNTVSLQVDLAQTARHYGTGTRAGSYLPQIALSGELKIGHTIRLTAFDTPGSGGGGVLLVGDKRDNAIVPGGRRWVSVANTFASDFEGGVDLQIPDDRALIGEPVFVQYSVYSPQSPGGWAWTEAIELRIGDR